MIRKGQNYKVVCDKHGTLTTPDCPGDAYLIFNGQHVGPFCPVCLGEWLRMQFPVRREFTDEFL